MKKPCFFCDVQAKPDGKEIKGNNSFFAKYSAFPIIKGHCEIIIKKHIDSFFELTPSQMRDFYDLAKDVKKIVDKKYHPDGYNVGINEGEAAGRSVHHLHIHLIPRYYGDVKNPRGGVRNIIPSKGDYFSEMAKNPANKKYL